MESVETNSVSTAKSTKKRKQLKSHDQDENIDENKKVRLFSARDFRKQLSTDEKFTALTHFSNILRESLKHNYILQYLENGGGCLEILQTLESDSNISPVLVFEIITKILLEINVNLPQYQNSAFEACRYILNSYITVLNKMLGLSSSKDERRICLKLLTAMVTISPTLGKDILLNVKFHSANLEILTKHIDEKNSVRDGFIHFLISFLVDGHYQTLSLLLEKTGLLTSIINGLQFDHSDTACLVLTALKNHVLENPSVYRTAKMVTFNTFVVREIVNLYNWKGPGGLRTNKNVFEVDKYEKSKVSEAVHDFLLTLCSSHKFGVIFRDPLVGTGKKNQNGLMYTVLESLDRPWEHSYAGELVVKICGSCPDLAKNVWGMLKPFLEPRLTEKWLKAVNFAKVLIKELVPSCIDYCAKNLAPHQLAQIIQILVAPLPILKTVIPENNVYENQTIKQNVFLLIFEMVKAIDSYLIHSKHWFPVSKTKELKKHLTNYISRNFPNVQTILENWNAENPDMVDFFDVALDILSLYKNLAPQLLENVSINAVDLCGILSALENTEKSSKLQMKLVSVFVDFDSTQFLPKNELFSIVMCLLLKFYHENRDHFSLNVLKKLLNNSGVFEDSFWEINIWIDGICNVGSFDDDLSNVLVEILRLSSENLFEYQEELSKFNTEEYSEKNSSELLEILTNFENNSDHTKPVKKIHLSPMIIACFKYFSTNSNVPKCFKKYLECVLLNLFHAQSCLDPFTNILRNYTEFVPSHFLNYVENSLKGNATPLSKFKGKLDVFQTFSLQFLNGNFDENLIKNSFYPDFYLDLLRCGTFYFSNAIKHGNVDENLSENWEKLVKFLLKEKRFSGREFFETIFENPVLISNFTIVKKNVCTKTLFSVIKEIMELNLNEFDDFLNIYRENIFNGILRVLKKPKKYQELTGFNDILLTIQLNYKQCWKIVEKISNFENTVDFPHVIEIFCYCLTRISVLCATDVHLEPLDGDIVKKISSYFINLIKNSRNTKIEGISVALKNYLNVFPHNIADLEQDLFISVLLCNEFIKENIDFCIFLLEKNTTQLVEEISKNFDVLSEKKAILVPLIDTLIEKNVEEKLLEIIYQKIEPTVMKALQKPQKTGQHLQKSKKVSILLERFLPIEKCLGFLEKVQKFEVSEVFHAKLLKTVYVKTIKTDRLSEKQTNNIILTFVHLQINVFKKNLKTNEETQKLSEISAEFYEILEKLTEDGRNFDIKTLSQNETVKLYFKYCLKFGVSSDAIFLKILTGFLKLSASTFEKNDAKLLLDMLLSHSEFLEVVLGEHGEIKMEILSLFLEICTNWSEFMERAHIPVLLAAYRAKVSRCDRIVLKLLKLYESKAAQTQFYDFKPFLWGRAAATHYSVRSHAANTILRQPKMSDVLDILQQDSVNKTIVNFPLTDKLNASQTVLDEDLNKCYDLTFLLPLFSQILAPEQQVKTYVFTRSGALSLTVVALSSDDKEVRQAACHVISRFYFHLEARQTGKDNLLWIRYVEALCKGTAVLPDFKLNNFVAIFFAKMASILTQPKNVMYFPLSRYLTAKPDLDFSTVPELYTLLHSSDVNFKEHRVFVLEILRDGLRTERDFKDFVKSMAYKLFMELFNSCLSDSETKLLILDVINSVCKLPSGVKVLCDSFSLLPQLYGFVRVFLCNQKCTSAFLLRICDVLLSVAKTKNDKNCNAMVGDILFHIVNSECFKNMDDDCLTRFFEVFYVVFDNSMGKILDGIFKTCDDKFCIYLRKYGCKYVERNDLVGLDDKFYHLRILLFEKFKG